MKNRNKILILVLLLAIVTGGNLYAKKSVHVVSRPNTPKETAACLPANNSNELTINNVRAYLETNGTMWFREIAEYEIPKNSGKTSMFCAALWIGGRDINGQLKLAAVRFRQVGDDYWTGPLTLNGATIDQETCILWDKHFKITRAEVEKQINKFAVPGSDEDPIPSSILNWPAHGDVEKGQSFYLAPFRDLDGNGEYNPETGDYPYYDIDNDLCPWTEQNIYLAQNDLLPKTPEELYYQGSANAVNGMIYADHVLKGDETLFWIFNDKGGVHTESGGDQIGLEIRGQAFGFTTNDELNNMTFYSYEIINRSTYTLTNTFFSQWVDPDLGYAKDDYVGCDVARGLGYCYNGKNTDGAGQVESYGTQPPAVGVDFFQGPYMDPDFNADGTPRDNPRFNKDSAVVDGYCDRFLISEYPSDQMAINGVNFGDQIPNNERFGMRRFVYHNNDNSVIGDPSEAFEYYNMLQGIWKDNRRMRYGANAHPINGANGPECDFMFPGLTDPCNWGTQGVDPNVNQFTGGEGWTEISVGNAPEDRRFMQSAGPFTLKPGAVNYITVGIPWARASQGGAFASVELLKIADDKCQSLFENCFKVLDGPDAPDVTIQELENELILYIENDNPIRNNYHEGYEEFDPQIPEGYYQEISETTTDTIQMVISQENDTFYITETNTDVRNEFVEYTDRQYHFEGYLFYQLKNDEVSVTDLDDPDKAQLIAQCDIENYRDNGTGIGQLVNWEYNDGIATSVATEKVNGSNSGIFHSLRITEDVFATGQKKLVNHKTYYFMVLAYAYNEYAPFSIDENIQNGLKGQVTPFLAGRKNIKVVPGTPHKTDPENLGTTLNSSYGTVPMITRIEGQGNGGFFLDMTDECRDRIMNGGDNGNWSISDIQYKNDFGPLGIKVVDPLRVQPFDYTIKFVGDFANNEADVTDSTRWVLIISDEVSDATLDSLGISRVDTSSMPISMTNEQLFLELGLSISIKNMNFAFHQADLEKYLMANGGYSYANCSRYGQCDVVGSTIEFADATKQWLSGVVDDEGDYPSNWIRSGQQSDGAWQGLSDGEGVQDSYERWRTEDACLILAAGTINETWKSRAFRDPLGQYEKLIYGTWAPYAICSPYDGGPQAKYLTPDIVTNQQPTPSYYDFTAVAATPNCPGFSQALTNLYSVDIVLTPDKDKWTRCLVLEAGSDENPNVNGNIRHEPKKSPSVGKDGQPDNSGTTGFGWFPGYAINIETGERLNIMFSENSSDEDNNGNDMLFNPTSVYAFLTDPQTGEFILDEETGEKIAINQVIHNEYRDYFGVEFGEPLMGGRHYIYVCGSTGSTSSFFYRSSTQKRNYNDGNVMRTSNGQHGGYFQDADGNYFPYYECGPYDEGQWLNAKFNTFVSNDNLGNALRRQVKMQLFNNVMWTSIPMPAFNQEENWLSNDATIKLRVVRPYMRYSSRWYDEVATAPNASQNYGFPMYEFTTKNIAPTTQNVEIHQSVLDNINIVPNPYYGSSTYENTALETYVKIVNLPEKCTISIFTTNGILVRTLTKGDAGTTFVNWDLKNHASIPVAGGMYIIHVKADGIGERTLKFFCAMRPTDVNTF